MYHLDSMGRDEGRQLGPYPGAGLSLTGFAGGLDMEGTAPDELPPARGKRDLWDRGARNRRGTWIERVMALMSFSGETSAAERR